MERSGDVVEQADPFGAAAPAFGAFAPDWRIRALRWALSQPATPALLRPALERTVGGLYKRAGREIFDVAWRGLALRLAPRRSVHDRVLMTTARQYDERYFDFLDDALAGRRITFVDVGANSGLYSLYAARIAAPGSTILAIEPAPDAARRLALHVAMNGFADRILLERVAIDETEGEVVMSTRDAGNDGVYRVVGEARGREAATSVVVQATTLPKLLERRKLERIDFMKIDVEGHEDRVLGPMLDAAPRTLWPARILMEVSGRAAWRSDALARLHAAGYATEFANETDALLARAEG